MAGLTKEQQEFARRLDGVVGQHEIARRLGVSVWTIRKFLSPEVYARQLQHSRDAKRKRIGTCVVCGGETHYNGQPGMAVSERCVTCANRSRVVWTRIQIIRAIRSWVGLHGRPPSARQWTYSTPDFPSTHTVQRVFGSWANGIEQAGFPRPRPGVRYSDQERRQAA